MMVVIDISIGDLVLTNIQYLSELKKNKERV